MRIAVDLENTIADINSEALQVLESMPQYEELDDSDRDHWDWPHEHYDFEAFYAAGQAVWNRDFHNIQPIVEGYDWFNELLNCARVDIVTARVGVDKQIRLWLDLHGYHRLDGFYSVSPSKSKAEMGYDVYFDDKPGLADEISSEQTLYLIDQPYNQHIDTDDYDNVIRVSNPAVGAKRLGDSDGE